MNPSSSACLGPNHYPNDKSLFCTYEQDTVELWRRGENKWNLKNYLENELAPNAQFSDSLSHPQSPRLPIVDVLSMVAWSCPYIHIPILHPVEELWVLLPHSRCIMEREGLDVALLIAGTSAARLLHPLPPQLKTDRVTLAISGLHSSSKRSSRVSSSNVKLIRTTESFRLQIDSRKVCI